MKKIGMQPIPMMDRDKKHEVPQGQVNENFVIIKLLTGRQAKCFFFYPMLWNSLNIGGVPKMWPVGRRLIRSAVIFTCQVKKPVLFVP